MGFLDCAPSSGQVVKVVYFNLSPSQNRLAICSRSMAATGGKLKRNVDYKPSVPFKKMSFR